jgi:ADP-ribosyl-[dinitrogen reductase] hydrolase
MTGVDTKALEELVDRAAAGGEPAELRERYRGTMLGVAAGNALGLPVEGESRHAIARRHPEGVREIDPAERGRPWDDDLAQTAILGEALLKMDELNLEYVGQQLVRWRRDNGRGIGGLTQDVLAEIEGGTPATEAARVVFESGGWSTAGNGALMRSAPVALRWRMSGAALVSAARDSALVTHYDARCIWSTVAFDVSLAVALSGGDADFDALASALGHGGAQGWEQAALEQVVEAVGAVQAAGRLDDLELDDPMDMGYTLKAMQVGLWCLLEGGDLESLLVDVVSAGGDTDTNGAIAGAALGARAGEGAIPRRWLENVPGTAELRELADGLLDAARR